MKYMLTILKRKDRILNTNLQYYKKSLTVKRYLKTADIKK